MSKFSNGFNGISADLLKAVTQVSRESSKQLSEKAATEKAALAEKMGGFKPLAKDQIVRESRPIERLYAGMTPNKVDVQKEETLADRVNEVKSLRTEMSSKEKMKRGLYNKEENVAGSKSAALQEGKVGENDHVKVTHRVGDREDMYTVHDKKTGKKETYGIHSYTTPGQTAKGVVNKQLKDAGVHPEAHDMIRKHALQEALLSDEDRAFLASVEEQTHPTTDKEKKLAAMAHPKDKITHKDVLVGRGVVAKEEAGAGRKAENRFHNKLDKLVHKTFGHSPDEKKDEKKDEMKEGWEDMLKAAEKRRADAAKPGSTTKTGHDVKKTSTGMVYTKKYDKKSGLSEAQAEERDTPGQEHICAVHVKHSKLGEGRTLFSQHADPAEDGSIAWYDVMFEEGIVRVATKDLEILVSEAHMNHKKKK